MQDKRKKTEDRRIPPRGHLHEHNYTDRALDRLLEDISLIKADRMLTKADDAMVNNWFDINIFDEPVNESKTRSIFYRTFGSM